MWRDEHNVASCYIIEHSSFNIHHPYIIINVNQSSPDMSTSTETSKTTVRVARQELHKDNISSPPLISNVEDLASYNWIESSTPTIVVPGSPAVWQQYTRSKKLQKDVGLFYIAQNAARLPEYPLEPLFRSLFICNPSFDILSVHIVTDRNNLRKLLDFVSEPKFEDKVLESFRINIEIIEDTIIFARTETKVQEYIGSNDFRGFGHTFEKAFTSEVVDGSTGHHRIISYDFGQFKILLRHETDACLDQVRSTDGRDKFQGIDSLSDELGSLKISSELPKLTSFPVPAGSRLEVKSGGQNVPRESTIEIKTRVSHKTLNIDDVAPQLWASQTTKLIRAYHKRGVFEPAQPQNVVTDIKDWEARKETELSKLLDLLGRITSIMKSKRKPMILTYDQGSNAVVLAEASLPRMLPDYLYSKWKLTDPVETLSNDACETKNNEKEAEGNSQKSHVKIKIGDREFKVDTVKMPYFASLLKKQSIMEKQGTIPVHSAIPYFDVAIKGLEVGYRHCFRMLPTRISEYRTLCTTYQLLEVDVLQQLSVEAIINNLKVGKSDLDEYSGRFVRGNKDLARDTAFQLVFLLLVAEPDDYKKDKLYNAVFYIISHPAVFKYKTKQVVRAAYESRFIVSPKQASKLDEWEQKGSHVEDDDATTPAEPDLDEYYDSDWS